MLALNTPATPMTKEELERFAGRSITFTVAGVPFLGAVHYTASEDSFRIVYPAVEDGRAKNENLQLNEELIERIRFDEGQNLLVMH